MQRINIKKYGKIYRIICFKTEIDKSKEPHFYLKEDKKENKNKLKNNLIRAKSRVMELALCNDWQYFSTLTIDEKKQDRFDLQDFKKDLGVWIGNYNKKFGTQLKYILIPEYHKDGAVHLHGLLNNVSADSLQKNEHNYLDLPYYKNRFGYLSLSKIKSPERVSRYITKYITKQFENGEKHKHLFLSSHGLKSAELIHSGFCSSDYQFQYENDFCKLSWLSPEDFEKFKFNILS